MIDFGCKSCGSGVRCQPAWAYSWRRLRAPVQRPFTLNDAGTERAVTQIAQL